MESVCIENLGELNRTESGHRDFLVITDRFTKMVCTVSSRGVALQNS